MSTGITFNPVYNDIGLPISDPVAHKKVSLILAHLPLPPEIINMILSSCGYHAFPTALKVPCPDFFFRKSITRRSGVTRAENMSRSIKLFSYSLDGTFTAREKWKPRQRIWALAVLMEMEFEGGEAWLAASGSEVKCVLSLPRGTEKEEWELEWGISKSRKAGARKKVWWFRRTDEGEAAGVLQAVEACNWWTLRLEKEKGVKIGSLRAQMAVYMCHFDDYYVEQEAVLKEGVETSEVHGSGCANSRVG